MKKLIFSILALAGFAACSADSELNETIAPEQKETFTIFAAQEDFDDTRVSINPDNNMHPTVLTWDEGDQINLATENGISVKLNAEEVNGKTAVFRTTQPVGYTKDDTYYACYPASHAISTTQLLYSIPATQSGLAKDAVVLYGEGDVDADTEGVQMNFEPVNAVLFVSVTDAPAEGFSKLEIRGYDNEQILCGQATFDGTETDRSLATGGTITINGSAANNNLKGVYVSLPGGVTFNTGYILTFTTVDGTVMSYGFNAKEMKVGSINEAQVKWTTPSVTLGAKTTYSYASTDPSKANSMGGGAAAGSGTTIFFNADYKSTISGVQNAMIEAMIEDCGFIVDGTTYSKTAGQVTHSGKEFWMSDLKNQSKADHTVQAFIKIKHNANIVYSAVQTLSVTGIPYSVSLTSQPSDWSFSGDYRFSGSGTDAAAGKYLRFKGDNDNSADAAITPKFYAPTNMNIKTTADCYHYCSNALASNKNATIYMNICNGSRPSSTSNGTTYKQSLGYGYFGDSDDAVANLTLTNANCYVGITHSTPKVTGTRWMCIQSFKVEYR